MNINNNMMVGGSMFFGASFMQSAATQIQQTPMQQIQQMQGMMQSMMQGFAQAAGQFMGQVGGGFAQSPATSPGFVNPPNQTSMFPTTPQPQGFAGGGFVGGVVIGGTGRIGTPAPAEKTGLIKSNNTPPEFTTPGGYKIKAEGKSAGWTITDPAGKTTRIWGDPHVNESDGTKWDFKKDMSFVLPDGTKIECKTTPPRPNGYTVTDSISIMNGNERATISGIAENKPKTDGIKQDRWAFDAKTADGDYAVLGKSGDDWFLNGKNEIVGSEKQGEILKTRAGNPNEAGISNKAQMAMGKQAPRFGGQQMLQMMMQQMLRMMMSMMSRPFGM